MVNAIDTPATMSNECSKIPCLRVSSAKRFILHCVVSLKPTTQRWLLKVRVQSRTRFSGCSKLGGVPEDLLVFETVDG
eukprot:6907430-Pyramimonas_sp.AAC.1